MKFASGLPFTDQERRASRAVCRIGKNLRAVRRHATPSGQNYNRPMTTESRKTQIRLIGESEKP